MSPDYSQEACRQYRFHFPINFITRNLNISKPKVAFQNNPQNPHVLFPPKKISEPKMVKIWFHFSLLRQMQSAMLSWANSAGIQSFMDSPGCLAYQDSWVGLIPKPQPTNQHGWKCSTLVVTIETRVGLGWVGGELVFATGIYFRAKILGTLEATKKKRRQEVGYFYGEKKPSRKTRNSHIPPFFWKKFGKLSTQKCGGR